MTRPFLAFSTTLAVIVATGTAALAEEAEIMTRTVGENEILTDSNGMTLYTFDKDADGMSSCYDDCAKNWPPLIASEGVAPEGDFGLTERTDGTMQWTYYDMPLYLWKDDAAPGDVTGDGVGDVWHIVPVEN